jgi:glycosyltransferase involved in cell wall biosynthesis
MTSSQHAHRIRIGLLTGGDDRPYALGLTLALAELGIEIDFVGSDNLDGPELHASNLIRFLNLRGDQSTGAPFFQKVIRLARYYLRLMGYALSAQPRIFHILWNNKVQFFDRTVLMAYYRLCGRRVVLTAHNVNEAARDGHDSRANRLSLAVQYRLSDHVFVHTEKMKSELKTGFAVPDEKITVIPFGIDNTTPRTDLTSQQARDRLGLPQSRRVALFFGQIAPYKGLEFLVAAAADLLAQDPEFVLLIAGKVKPGAMQYWREIEASVPASDRRVIANIQHIPDASVEVYFKAADVLVLPYAQIFQSGVLFLSYSFGLPVVATDVGSLREHVIEGETGLICPPRDPAALAGAIQAYFASDLYRNLTATRARISELANERCSWKTVAELTRSVYERLPTNR